MRASCARTRGSSSTMVLMSLPVLSICALIFRSVASSASLDEIWFFRDDRVIRSVETLCFTSHKPYTFRLLPADLVAVPGSGQRSGMCKLQSTTHNFGLHRGHCAGFPRYMHSLNIRPQTVIRASIRHHSCRQQARASAPDGREPACSAQIQMGRLPLGLLAPASIALPARADVSESLQQGSALIQKDAVISVAFTVAVIALGAVTLGVSSCCF